jgi:trans-aconitate 2-methyltransferase
MAGRRRGELMQSNKEDVREFYNEFMSKRMVNYRLNGNLRVESAANFFASHICEDDMVVDVGCGIGIASEVLAKKARSGTVIGIDISDKNIWYANKTVRLPNVEFHALDIIHHADSLRALLKGKAVDAFTLGDVLEHISDDERALLFRSMAALGSPAVKVLITIPSEFYQRYLMAEQPNELQIIDNIITPSLLEQEGRREGFALTYFRVIAMWKPAQYVHCVLEREIYLVKKMKTSVPTARTNALLQFSQHFVRKLFVHPRRYKKYVTEVFDKRE